MAFNLISYLMGKKATGGSSDITLLTRAEWDALTTEQK